MSTRAFICIATPAGVAHVYSHHDGYPSHLLAALEARDAAKGQADGDAELLEHGAIRGLTDAGEVDAFAPDNRTAAYMAPAAQGDSGIDFTYARDAEGRWAVAFKLATPVAPARPPVTYTVRATESAGPGREFLNRAAATDWARYRQAMTGATHEVCEVYAG